LRSRYDLLIKFIAEQQQQPGAGSAPVSAPNDAEQPTVTTSFPPADNTAIPCKSMFEQLLDHEGEHSAKCFL